MCEQEPYFADEHQELSDLWIGYKKDLFGMFDPINMNTDRKVELLYNMSHKLLTIIGQQAERIDKLERQMKDEVE